MLVQAAPDHRRIAHLDMDAFYASVELLRNPALRGQALVVGGARRSMQAVPADNDWPRLRDYVGRGVATTASYEARALGVHSAMGLMKAAHLAPDAILLPADFDEYRRQSRAFKAAVAAIAPCIEDRGIDEIYIDLTGLDPDTHQLAQRLKDAVREATGLSCSIGVSPNKLLAKIASDLDKPDGLTLLDAADVPVRIWPMPVRRINGIGPKAEARLHQLEIRTIGELAAVAPERLVEVFGTHYGQWLHDAAHGRDQRPVVTHSDPKSISRETTFPRDLDVRRDRAELTGILLGLGERLAGDLARKQVRARTIGIKVRFADFSVVTRDLTLPLATMEAAQLVEAARGCLKRVTFGQRLRLLGVRASGLVPAGAAGSGLSGASRAVAAATLPLFDFPA